MSLNVDELFRLDVSALTLIVRTSVVYLLLLTALRLVARREMGSWELPDLLMIVLIADGVQNAMSGEYQSVTGGLIVAGTLIGWNCTLDWIAHRSAFARRLLRPAPLKLVENGRMLKRNMRRELITEDELRAQLRVQGIEDLSEVAVAHLEPDGDLSVIKRAAGAQSPPPSRRRAGVA